MLLGAKHVSSYKGTSPFTEIAIWVGAIAKMADGTIIFELRMLGDPTEIGNWMRKGLPRQETRPHQVREAAEEVIWQISGASALAMTILAREARPHSCFT